MKTELLKKTFDFITSSIIIFIIFLYAKSFWHYIQNRDERIEILFLQYLGITIFFLLLSLLFFLILVLIGERIFMKIKERIMNYKNEPIQEQEIDYTTPQVPITQNNGVNDPKPPPVDGDKINIVKIAKSFFDKNQLTNFNINDYSNVWKPLFLELEYLKIELPVKAEARRNFIMPILLESDYFARSQSNFNLIECLAYTDKYGKTYFNYEYEESENIEQNQNGESVL